MRTSFLIIIALISLYLVSCSKLDEDIVAPKVSLKLTYKNDIKPILDRHCVPCHNQASSDFDLSTYFGIAQSGIAFAGDPSSKIILVTQVNGSKRRYLGDDADAKAEKIRKWVVNDSLAFGDVKIHPDDWVQIGGFNSHGKYIRSANWNLEQCKECHGSNYTGGSSRSSCYTCHTASGGPEACNTCHGNHVNSAPPRDLNNNFSISSRGVGTHQIHVRGGKYALGYKCDECHINPPNLYSPGHLDDTPTSEVIFQEGTLARRRTLASDGRYIVPNPVYNPDSLTCSNTYCHGYFKNGNFSSSPKWNVVGYGCSSCHSLPPGGSHPRVSSTSCANICHEDVVGISGGKLYIKDKSKHVNGKLSLSGLEIDFSIR